MARTRSDRVIASTDKVTYCMACGGWPATVQVEDSRDRLCARCAPLMVGVKTK